jgi:hypothetical protein
VPEAQGLVRIEGSHVLPCGRQVGIGAGEVIELVTSHATEEVGQGQRPGEIPTCSVLDAAFGHGLETAELAIEPVEGTEEGENASTGSDGPTRCIREGLFGEG